MMKTPFSFYVIGLVSILSQVPGQSFAEEAKIMSKDARIKHIRVNREVTWSIIENLITLNEYDLADSVLEEHLRVDVKDGKSWLFKSQILARQGKKDEARTCIVKAKKQIADSEPEMLLYAESELAMAEGNSKKGLEGFKKIAAGDSPLAKKAQKTVDAIEAKKQDRRIASLSVFPGLIEPKSVHKLDQRKLDVQPELSLPWTANVNLSLMTGYDANILQISDSIVPFASDLGSAYSALGLQGALSGGALGGVLSFTGATAYTRNLSSIAEGLNNLNLSGGMQWAPTPDQSSNFAWSLGVNTATTFMESSSYRLFFISTTFQPTLAYRINSLMNAEMSLNYAINRFPGVELTSARDNRAGSQYGASLGLRGMVAATSYSTGVAYAQQKTEGENFNTNSLSLNASVSQPISFWKSSLNPGVGFTKVQYPNSDTGRDDNMYSANLGWDVPVLIGGESFRTTSSLGWSHVNSKDESATFTKTTLTLQVVYAIK